MGGRFLYLRSSGSDLLWEIIINAASGTVYHLRDAQTYKLAEKFSLFLETRI